MHQNKEVDHQVRNLDQVMQYRAINPQEDTDHLQTPTECRQARKKDDTEGKSFNSNQRGKGK